MSDPLSNLEIQDVLSSIRRLVSEDRRTKEIAQGDAEPEEPAVEKLLLTDALRIESEGGQTGQPETVAITAEPDDAAEEQDLPGKVPAPVRPASVLEDDIASLETTIAELEAAVAGIGQDFEPDGSEVRHPRGEAGNQALEDAFDDGFAVDLGGPARFESEDAALSAPIAGDAMAAKPSGRAADAPAEPETDEADPNAEDAEATPGADEIAFLRHQTGARRPDLQLISGGDRLLATAGAVLSGRLHLGAANSVGDPDDGNDGVAGDDSVSAVTEAVEETTPEAAALDQGEAARGADGTEDDAEPVENVDHATQPEVAEAEADESAPDTQADEALAGMPDLPEADRTDAAAAPEPPAAALPGGGAEPTEENDADDVGLFADDTADIDMDMLRDLVAEMIREELQGPLGERITRNVRKLVRQEIARALEAQKFD